MASCPYISRYSYMPQNRDLLPYQHLVEEKDRESFRKLSLEIFDELVKNMNEAEKLSVKETLKKLGLDPAGRKTSKEDLHDWTFADFLIALKTFVKERYKNVDMKTQGFNPRIEYIIRKSGRVIYSPSWHSLQDESLLFAYMEISGIAKKN